MIMESSLLSGPDCEKAQLILALNNDVETLTLWALSVLHRFRREEGSN